MIIITGGAGFIGSFLMGEIVKQGFHQANGPLIVVDHLGKADKWRNLQGLPIAEFIAPYELFDWLVGKESSVSVVFHLGASSATTETDVDFIIRQNFSYTIRLADWCASHKIRFIYASSASVYGDGSHGFEDSNHVDYHSQLRPLNPYGWSKWLADGEMLRRFANHENNGGNGSNGSNWLWVGLRFFNVYGPHESHKGAQRSVAHQMLHAIRKTGRVVLFKSANPTYADGEQSRDFIWVGDCADIMIHFGFSKSIGKSGSSGIYNCGSGRAEFFLSLAKHCFAALGKPPIIDWIETPESLRPHYQYFTKAKMDKLKKIGHYEKSLTPLASGIKVYADWLETNDYQG